MDQNVINSNREYLESELNKIKSEITRMAANSTTYNNYVSSTTYVPSNAPKTIRDFVAVSKSLLDKMNQDLNNIIEIAKKIENLDERLKFEATELGVTLTSTALATINEEVISSKEAEYAISNDTHNVLKSIEVKNVNQIDLNKYAENKAGGFYLWISSKRYTLRDFENSVWRKKYGYTAEQALEAFIGCVIAESDKTIDDVLAITSVILNRCESSSWGPHYQNGTNPFDQLWAKNGAQFSVITERKNGHRRYENYMPSVVGNKAYSNVAAYKRNTYEELRNAVIEALEGGLRNNDYTGFRANGYEGWDNLRHITPNGNKYHYEVRGVDDVLAERRRANRTMTDLSGTAYKSSRKVAVERGSDLQNITDTLSRAKNSNARNIDRTNTSNGTSTSGSSSNTTNNDNVEEYNDGDYTSGGSSSHSNKGTSSTKVETKTEEPTVVTTSNPEPKVVTAAPIAATKTEEEPVKETKEVKHTSYNNSQNDIYYNPLPTNNYKEEPVEPVTEVETIEPAETEEPVTEKKGNGIATALGVTAAVGAAAGAAMYGYNEYKKRAEEYENEDYEELETDDLDSEEGEL